MATGLRRARQDDMKEAIEFMRAKRAQGQGHAHTHAPVTSIPWDGPTWNLAYVESIITKSPARCLVLIGEFVVDATSYLKEHVRITITSIVLS